MDVKVEVREEEAWRRILAIEVPAADVAREYEQVARKVARTVKLPGFRKGKVPVSVVRKSFKTELDAEFLETIVPKAFGRALDETGIDPVSEPKFEDLSYGDERPLSFTADFECRPVVELGELKGLAAEKQVPEVTDQHVDSVLEDFRKSRAKLEEVDREAIDGDVVEVDYQALDQEGHPVAGRSVEGYALELGTNQVVDEFEAAVKGATPGAVRTAEVAYPAEYPDGLLAGTTQHYRIRVKTVKEKRFPELDDALVATHSDLKTVDELRAKVREDLEKQADRAGTDRLEQVLLQKVVEAHPFETPKSLVDGLLDDFVERRKQDAARRGEDAEALDVDRLRTENREAAAREVRRMLLLEMIAERESLQVTGDELRERVELLSRMRRVPPRKLVDDLGGDRFLRGLSREMRDKKVLAFLVENAEITVTKVPARPPEAS